jgi:hypothetical protein
MRVRVEFASNELGFPDDRPSPLYQSHLSMLHNLTENGVRQTQYWAATSAVIDNIEALYQM